MARNGTNTIFSSEWNIDQIGLSGEKTIAVGANDVELFNFSSLNLGFQPKFYVAAKQAGSNVWEQSGNRLRARVYNNRLYVYSEVFPSTNWTLRYYILNTPVNSI